MNVNYLEELNIEKLFKKLYDRLLQGKLKLTPDIHILNCFLLLLSMIQFFTLVQFYVSTSTIISLHNTQPQI